jgi:hypothetical protein
MSKNDSKRNVIFLRTSAECSWNTLLRVNFHYRVGCCGLYSAYEEQEINLAVYGVGYALPIVALAYFMKIRYEMRNRENTRDNGQ